MPMDGSSNAVTVPGIGATGTDCRTLPLETNCAHCWEVLPPACQRAATHFCKGCAVMLELKRQHFLSDTFPGIVDEQATSEHSSQS